MSSVKVVILDIGGVVCPSPFPVFERYEKKSGMPKGSINSLLAHDEDWEELECGHIGAPTFVKRVLERKQLNMGNIFEELGRGAPDAGLCVLLNALRSAGVRLCAVTNNFFLDSSRSASAFPESIRGLFDVVVESCKEGVRKGKGGRGGSAIFRTAVERLGVRPEECLFLDDIGGNLKDARDLGMHTELVKGGAAGVPPLIFRHLGLSPPSVLPKVDWPRKGLRLPPHFVKEIAQKALLPNRGAGALQDALAFQFSHGQSNPTYLIVPVTSNVPSQGTPPQGTHLKLPPMLVVRTQPPGPLLPRAHDVVREATLMQALGKASEVPVPSVVSVHREGEGRRGGLGRDFVVTRYVEGVVFVDPGLRDLPPAKRRQVYEETCRVLACVHSVDLDRAGLGGLSRKGGYVERQVKTWKGQYARSRLRQLQGREGGSAESPMERLASELEKSISLSGTSGGVSERVCLVHGDFRIDNLIFCPKTLKCVAVLDWELSTLGDPLSELAYLLIPHILPPSSNGIKAVLPVLPSEESLAKEGIPTASETAKMYAEAVKRSSVKKGGDAAVFPKPALESDSMRIRLAVSLFRVAAILQGVVMRASQGSGSSAALSDAFGGDVQRMQGELVDSVALQALKILQGPRQNGEGPVSGMPGPPTGLEVAQRPASGVPPFSVPELFGEFQWRGEALDFFRKVHQFVHTRVIPLESALMDHSTSEGRWKRAAPEMEALKEAAKKEGLWNFFMSKELDPSGRWGGKGLTNLEYAVICETTGWSVFAPECFNCAAPDTGNMETLLRFGNDQQKERWLRPVADGRERSCFAMTEPHVASSDALNIQSAIRVIKGGRAVRVTGRKWYISGAMDPRCTFAVVLGLHIDEQKEREKEKKGGEGKRKAERRQDLHSVVIVPMSTEGVNVERPHTVFGYDDAPHGHAEMTFDCEVPIENVLLGPGRGFEIAQGRLGGGRLHHCLRLLGAAERSMRLMARRAFDRTAFGGQLSSNAAFRERLARCRVQLDSAKWACYHAADLMDKVSEGKVPARKLHSAIAKAKVQTPEVAGMVIDEAIQLFGAAGVSDVTPLAYLWAQARTIRLADGPDAAHLRTVARLELLSQEEKQKSVFVNEKSGGEKQLLKSSRSFAALTAKM